MVLLSNLLRINVFNTLICYALSLVTIFSFGPSCLYADADTDDVLALSRIVLVTVAPHKYLVNRIAGDTVQVEVIVPPTGNVHTFEPTPKQMMRVAEADVWFRIGESFEPRLAEAFKSHHAGMRIVDMRQNLDLIYDDQEHGSCCRHADGMDLHFWLSARQMKLQAKTVLGVLVNLYPEHEAQYRKAFEEHLHELGRLDNELRMELTRIKGKTLLVGHPAYAYFCRDYHLEQLSIESEGKDPTPQQLTALLRKIKALHLRTIFSQIQYSPKVADIIKEQMGPDAKVVELDPYAEDYMQNMRSLARHFLQA